MKTPRKRVHELNKPFSYREKVRECRDVSKAIHIVLVWAVKISHAIQLQGLVNRLPTYDPKEDFLKDLKPIINK